MIDLSMRMDHENDEWWRESPSLSCAQFFHKTSTKMIVCVLRGGGDCTQATKLVVENCQCYVKKTNQRQFSDHHTFLGNCLPTPPLSQNLP